MGNPGASAENPPRSGACGHDAPKDEDFVAMPSALRIGFATIAAPARGVLIVFADDGLRLGSATQALLKPAGDLVARAAGVDGFKGKSGSALDIVAPAGLKASRLVGVGVRKASDLGHPAKLGGP